MSRELIFSVTKKDFRIDTFRAGGKGGQHQNTTDSGVRITHIETGFSAESRTHKSQKQNIKEAFRRLANSKKMKRWVKRKSLEALGRFKNIDLLVQEQMQDKYIKTEHKENGKWIIT